MNYKQSNNNYGYNILNDDRVSLKYPNRRGISLPRSLYNQNLNAQQNTPQQMVDEQNHRAHQAKRQRPINRNINYYQPSVGSSYPSTNYWNTSYGMNNSDFCRDCCCCFDCIDCIDCSGCDCNGCDCNGCDCNGCDCNCNGCDCRGCDQCGQVCAGCLFGIVQGAFGLCGISISGSQSNQYS